MTSPVEIAAHVVGELDRVGRLGDGEETAQFIATLLQAEYPDADEMTVRAAIDTVNKGIREAAERRVLGLRKIEPISTHGLDMGKPEHGEPICERVNPRDLFVDPAYQRSIGERGLRQIRQIVEGWDWNRFKPPICAYAEHEGQTVLKVLDGQHTAIAACTHRDISQIVEAAASADQAAAFVGQNTGNLAVTALQLHRSSLVADDPDAVTIDSVCRSAGVKILATQPKKFNPGETVAVGIIGQMVDRRGAMKSRMILEVLAKAGFAPITGPQIKAVELLMTDDEYKNAIDPDDLVEAIKDGWLVDLEEAKTKVLSHRLTQWKALAIVWFRKCKKRRLTTGRAAA